MRKLVILTAAALGALAAVSAFGAWVYEGQWGGTGSGKGQLSWPHDVAIGPNNTVYVADGINHRIQYFTLNGSYLGEWGSRGRHDPGEFITPRGVAVARNGNVYVADTGNDRVQYFTSTGSFLGMWGSTGSGQGDFRGPWPIGVGPGNIVYVGDNDLNALIQYFTSVGSFLGEWGGYGYEPGKFKSIKGLAIAPNGNVYVSDSDLHTVQYFTPTGSYLGRWGSYQELDNPTGVGIDSTSRVFVASWHGCFIKAFTSTGSFLASWGEVGSGNGQFISPFGIATILGGKRVYVVDRNNDRIQYFRESPTAVTPASLGRVKALFK